MDRNNTGNNRYGGITRSNNHNSNKGEKMSKFAEVTKGMIMLEEGKYHYFGANIGTWRVSMDLKKLIHDMEEDKAAFYIFLVPLPEKSTYAINFCVPMVMGTQMIYNSSVQK
jgi:hypothetical protein